MALHITVDEANAWADRFKLNFGELDSELENSQAVQVLARVSQAYTVTSWVDSATTPSLVRKIIAMMYVGWYYQRTYSEDGEMNSYGVMLITAAENLLSGIVDGSLALVDAVVGTDLHSSEPGFYPTDASSALVPTTTDSSLGPAKFTMGTIW